MKTLAVVIGNNTYHAGATLDYAVKDADAIAEVFKRLGYDVLHHNDCTTSNCSILLENFESKISGYDATIFYFAGHGFQFEGENYLTSIECQISHPTKFDCSRNSIRLTEILDILKKHTNKVNIIIIDACRKSFDRGNGPSFAAVSAPKGTLVAFSTSPGDGAKDGGYGNHSLYTGALLNYIGREWISVEELFKKVRKTVSNLSQGMQTPWEHTSLIGDFYFNTGQLVYSLDVPYSDDVVKDGDYKGDSSEFSQLIFDVRSSNWNKQNPAIDKLLQMQTQQLDKNRQFLLGRNLLQASGYAFSASNFFENLGERLKPYSVSGENHVLNGILFEIYFDNHGEFRKDRFKTQSFEEVMTLRRNPLYAKSFTFIADLLKPLLEIKMFWIPETKDVFIDADVLATPLIVDTDWEGQVLYDVINSIHILGIDVTNQIRKYDVWGKNALGLQAVVANYLSAPKELVKLNLNREINRIRFPAMTEVVEDSDF